MNQETESKLIFENAKEMIMCGIDDYWNRKAINSMIRSLYAGLLLLYKAYVIENSGSISGDTRINIKELKDKINEIDDKYFSKRVFKEKERERIFVENEFSNVEKDYGSLEDVIDKINKFRNVAEHKYYYDKIDCAEDEYSIDEYFSLLIVVILDFIEKYLRKDLIEEFPYKILEYLYINPETTALMIEYIVNFFIKNGINEETIYQSCIYIPIPKNEYDNTDKFELHNSKQLDDIGKIMAEEIIDENEILDILTSKKYLKKTHVRYINESCEIEKSLEDFKKENEEWEEINKLFDEETK
nr:MAG TPA: hypothetical protein [Caudoviricetes sp.]